MAAGAAMAHLPAGDAVYMELGGGYQDYSWLQKFWPKTQILLGNGLLL